jgi:5-methylthioadenosine/S-adenosylhomocysteine deaminase
MGRTVDILIEHGIVITMRGKGVGVIEDGAVGVLGSRIEAVGETAEVRKAISAHRVIDASGKAVLPGLIDAHIHTALGLVRGVAQDLHNWMQHGLWPFDSALRQDIDAVRKGSLMNIMEALKAGTTTFCDFDSPMEEIVKNHVLLGTRARVAEMINELPREAKTAVGELYIFDPAEGERKMQNNLRLFEHWHGGENGRITCLFGPQGADMCSKELLMEIRRTAERFDTGIHMHVCQGDREVNQMMLRYGARPIPFLDEAGYLDRRLLAVHLTEATAEEAHLVAKRGAGMALCSGSIGIIDGVVPPAAEFLEAGGSLALGSDQAPGNNCNNMFNEMKFTAILNKCRARDPTVFPAWQALRLATADAAHAIGLGDEIGSLEQGKKADIIIVDLTQPGLSPVISRPIRNVVPNLVYSARGSEVQTVIVDGRVLIDDFKVLPVDEKQVVQEAQEAANRVAAAVVPALEKISGNPLREMMAQDQL